MKGNIIYFILFAAISVVSVSCSITNNGDLEAKTVYDFFVEGRHQEQVSLSDYKGKVILIVNTASRCGFTPQYEELEAMYEEYCSRGFVILDFPCNQFGQQAPESDEDYARFCKLNYDTKFPQFHKIEVNGDNEIALYTWLKHEKGFAGFDPKHQLTPILHDMFSKADPDYARKPDIKWNFTKFLIDRDGNVVSRFEPTATKDTIAPAIEQLL